MRLFIAIALVVAAAVPDGAQRLSDDQMYIVRAGSKQYTCGLISARWRAGRFDSASGTFLSFNAQVKNLKKKLKTASGGKRSSLQAKIARVNAQARAGNSACSGGKGGGGSATPTPLPQQPQGNFDLSGNVTAKGKATFGIPSQLSANITSGRSVYNSFCVGCHTERTNRSFSDLRTNIARSPMLYDSVEIPDSSLAHLTAYLNRFRMD